MDFLVAFCTDDGEHLINDHAGMAKFFDIYKFSDRKVEFVECRKNAKYKGDESIKHGDPQKAQAVASVTRDIHAMANKKFGPNITRMLKKFLCIVVRTDTIKEATEMVNRNLPRIIEGYNKGENRKHIVINKDGAL